MTDAHSLVDLIASHDTTLWIVAAIFGLLALGLWLRNVPLYRSIAAATGRRAFRKPPSITTKPP